MQWQNLEGNSCNSWSYIPFKQLQTSLPYRYSLIKHWSLLHWDFILLFIQKILLSLTFLWRDQNNIFWPRFLSWPSDVLVTFFLFKSSSLVWIHIDINLTINAGEINGLYFMNMWLYDEFAFALHVEANGHIQDILIVDWLILSYNIHL